MQIRRNTLVAIDTRDTLQVRNLMKGAGLVIADPQPPQGAPHDQPIPEQHWFCHVRVFYPPEAKGNIVCLSMNDLTGLHQMAEGDDMIPFYEIILRLARRTIG